MGIRISALLKGQASSTTDSDSTRALELYQQAHAARGVEAGIALAHVKKASAPSSKFNRSAQGCRTCGDMVQRLAELRAQCSEFGIYSRERKLLGPKVLHCTIIKPLM